MNRRTLNTLVLFTILLLANTMLVCAGENDTVRVLLDPPGTGPDG